MAEAKQERRTDYGPPNYEKFLPPIIKANYGKWKYHEIIKPGVMVHVGESGDKLYTVRASSGRLISIDKIRMISIVAHRTKNEVQFILGRNYHELAGYGSGVTVGQIQDRYVFCSTRGHINILL